jgi:uncharacterized protein YbjT (DUF2867 family)
MVAGASGRFGQVVEQLLERGHRVRAGTRDTRSVAAEQLSKQGAEIVPVDFDDVHTIAAAARGVDAVFATGTAHRAGPHGELRHGRNLATALALADAPHLVFVSGAGAHTPTAVPVLEAKRQVEEAIRAVGVTHTLLAPVYLMENLFNPWNRGPLRAGVMPSPVPPSAAMQQIATEDIVALAVLAIEQRERFAGQRLELASDQLSAIEAAGVLSRVLGTKLEATPLRSEGLPPPLRALFEWLVQSAVSVDIDALRERFPEIGWHRFDDWTEQHAATIHEFVGTDKPGARNILGR